MSNSQLCIYYTSMCCVFCITRFHCQCQNILLFVVLDRWPSCEVMFFQIVNTCCRSVFVAQTSGIVKSIKLHCESTENLEYLRLEGGAVERMRRSTLNPNIIAVGGKENNLKLWDLSTRKMVFAAKNVSSRSRKY